MIGLLLDALRGGVGDAERRRRPPPASSAEPDEGADADALVRRRIRMRRWWESPRAPTPPDATGLALSGGGIRSATFSLGALQALARRGRLAEVDVLSTVSGGSYIGCFLRSLFMPQQRRGIAPRPGAPDPLDLRQRYLFAMDALRSDANQRTVLSPDGLRIRNPIWWLREHSRYLAPNGAVDYGYAAAYLTRNWASMLYVFALGIAGVLAATAMLDVLVTQALAWHGGHWPTFAATPTAPTGECDLHLPAALRVSGSAACGAARAAAEPPLVWSISLLLLLATLPLTASVGVSMAYWLTSQMSVNEPKVLRQLWSFLLMVVGAVMAAAGLLAPFALWSEGWSVAARLAVRIGLGLVALELAIGALWFLVAIVRSSPDQLLTAELRRRLTTLQAGFNLAAAILLGLGIVETLAVVVRAWFWNQSHLSWQVSLASVPPLLAFVIQRLQRMTAGAGGKGGWLAAASRFLPAIALVVGMLLYGAVAVVVGALVDAAVWNGDPWIGIGHFDRQATVLMLAGIVSFGLLTGRSTGFINLSSLHALYASRLTRAYLGATNERRLRTFEDPTVRDVTILDNHDLDYIQPEIYGQTDLPAPLHVINVTANRTVDESSSLVARDRKGELLSVEPHGVQLGSGHDRKMLRWSVVGSPKRAESLSLGQWCAISGAAASTGMGRLTSLGYAIALTFANVRLGYWWWVPAGRPPQPTLPVWRRLRAAAGRQAYRLFSTFFYLLDEMTARYSRSYDRQYLSDGGHFENTGAYALIRRDVPRIVICDNAQDQHYAFADLENLIRKARLDLGRELSLLSGSALGAFLATLGCTRPALFVDTASDPDWKETMRVGRGEAFVLAFEARGTRPLCGGEAVLHLLLVKPRLLPGMPEDVAGYASANPPFPQQTTGDQFFDEAQWESYRRLGEYCMGELLDACPSLFQPRRAPERRYGTGPTNAEWPNGPIRSRSRRRGWWTHLGSNQGPAD